METNPSLEQESSAVTLSDMEIFIFPRLLYALVLADIMSPAVWRWREDPWFDGIDKMSPLRRIHRLKQYIMNNYVFNLDLDTWGLTTKEKELARFSGFAGEETLKKSNALFGYEGDKYYFDIDIRKHFGLDKYSGNVIPYWKTETVEAMDAFVRKDGYNTGAGECVSLAALYAAALFIVAGVALKDIFLMGTPLHSQNFIMAAGGVLTNNRRIVTKNMWFNGTALSGKARRALEKERVTIVAHESGFIHYVSGDATIDRGVYEEFSGRLGSFLKTNLDAGILGAFLRARSELRVCFQVQCEIAGRLRYIALEKLFEYEMKYPYMLTDSTRKKLIDRICPEDLHSSPIPGRLILNEVEAYIEHRGVDLADAEEIEKFKRSFSRECFNLDKLFDNIRDFCITVPRLPEANAKNFIKEEPPGIENGMSRGEIIERLEKIRNVSETARLAFFAFRDMMRCPSEPFLRAAVARNPVSLAALEGASLEEAASAVWRLGNESIYEEDFRLAQPDEVWNFSTGDGLEKAVLLANIFAARGGGGEIIIETGPGTAKLRSGGVEYGFPTSKKVRDAVWRIPAGRS